MPQRKCAIKRLRADKKRKAINLRIKNDLKRTIKSFLGLISQSKLDEAKSSINKVIAKVDKAATKSILSKNNASRKKSLLMRKLNSLSKK